jgi:hypothetical protein
LDILPYEKWLPDEHPTNRFTLLEKLTETEVHILDDAGVLGVGKDLSMMVSRDSVEYKIHVNSIIIASGFTENNGLAKEVHQLKGSNSSPAIHEIGDCAEVRDLHWAIREGYEVGTTI